jgi:hypothetical protein
MKVRVLITKQTLHLNLKVNVKSIILKRSEALLTKRRNHLKNPLILIKISDQNLEKKRNSKERRRNVHMEEKRLDQHLWI